MLTLLRLTLTPKGDYTKTHNQIKAILKLIVISIVLKMLTLKI